MQTASCSGNFVPVPLKESPESGCEPVEIHDRGDEFAGSFGDPEDFQGQATSSTQDTECAMTDSPVVVVVHSPQDEICLGTMDRNVPGPLSKESPRTSSE